MKRALILAAVSATSLLGLATTAQAELRASKNYRLAHDPSTNRIKDMTALAVNPNNANHVVQVDANYLSEDCEGTRSLDGGTTWSRADAFAVPPGYAQSCRISTHLAESMYQTVAFGSGQNVYATYITPQLAAGGGEQGQAVVVVRSTDGGQNWDQPVIAMANGPTQTTGPNYELPTITVDPAGAPGGADRVVVAAHELSATGLGAQGDAAVAVSNNGGQSFLAPVAVDGAENATDTSQPVIAPDNSISVAWRQVGVQGAIKVARSTDPNGQNWSPPVTVALVSNNSATSNSTVPNQFIPSPNTPPFAPTGNFSSGSSFPRLAVGPQGQLYIVYNQASTSGGTTQPAGPQPPPGGFQGADHFIPPDSDVYFQRSLTNGATWSAPELVNEADPKPGNESPANPQPYGVVTQTRHPNVYVAPNGRVDILWDDRRHWYRGCIHTHLRCEEARLGDTYYAFSNNAGAGPASQISFSRNRRITDRSINKDVGTDYRFGHGWAFGPVAAHQGNNLLVSWMDSREGSFQNDNQDIYLAKVNHSGPSTVPQETLNRTTPVDTSVRLSRHTYPGGGESLLASTFATRNGTRVVIVNENDYPAILAAGVLARANLSHVLLSPAGRLPANVRAEVARMSPAGAYVIGDTGDLSNQVIDDLVAAGVGADDDPATNPRDQIERLGGGSSAATARAIAQELDRRNSLEQAANDPAFNAVIVANPNSPDASAAAGLAAARRLPFLFVNQNSVPGDTQGALAPLDIDKALVVGGTQWVSDAVASQFPAAERLGGANQYATSQAVVAESLERGLPDNIAYVADGARPIDGALLGSTVGRVNGLQMLARAPLSTNAPGVAAATGVSGRLDRLILLQPAPAGSGPRPGPAPQPSAPFADCPTSTANVIQGNAASNSIVGTTRADRIFAGTGNDTVDGLAGNDCIDLGPGTDRGQGGDGADLIVGGLGRDRMVGNIGNDRLRGGSSADRLNGGFGNDRLHGQSGTDRINGSRGRDRINGGSSNDVISAGSSRDRVAGDQGNDRINGNSGNDSLLGNSGRDRIKGSSGRDRISGGSGNDRINSRDGRRDRVNCGSGRDRVVADAIDRLRNCERVRRSSSASRSSALKTSGLVGIPGLLGGGALLGLLGWRRRG